MNEEKRILDVLGQVSDEYIEEAVPGNKPVKTLKKAPGWFKWGSIAAGFAILVLASHPFLQNDSKPFTPSEADPPPAATQTAEHVIPPMTVKANGLHLVQLVYGEQTESDVSTDFIIHINPSSYAGREENGAYVIRPTTPLGEGFPECSLQINRAAGLPPAAAAEMAREKLSANYQHIGDVGDSDVTDGLFLHADNGSTWDAEQVDVTITDDLVGGSYILTARYFTEAAEGHGVRFADMAGTFKALTSADTDAVPSYLVELHRTISVFASAFFSDHISEISDILAQDAQVYTYDTDVTDEVNVASTDYRISGDENPAAAVVSVKHRISTEDSYNYLTIELTYINDGADSRWIVDFAGIEK